MKVNSIRLGRVLPSRNKRAFSLIEVVASLFLLGTLLVSILVAYRSHAQQIRTARHRLAAIEKLDTLLTIRSDSSQNSGEFLRPQGRFPEESPYWWRTVELYSAEARQLGGMILRIEVFDPDFLQGETLSAVEILSLGANRGTQP